jgi:hypothetical protein
MMTMKTSSVIGWLNNQGMIDAAANFKNTFGHMGQVDRQGVEAFLVLYYGEFASEVFLDMKCNVLTFMNLDTQN